MQLTLTKLIRCYFLLINIQTLDEINNLAYSSLVYIYQDFQLYVNIG